MSTHQDRNTGEAVLRGMRCKCPSCGVGSAFNGYLEVKQSCDNCGEELHHHRADDAPPYFTIFIVGHVVVALAMWVEMAYVPPMWLHMAIWLPLTLIMALAFLRPIKGALVGLQWALRMDGFATAGKVPSFGSTRANQR
ncbi:hypothetical protein PsAD2_04224 [Pseudovibrio axinellae]|uniref:Zinc-finger protein n=2 Tax=Pseudovibrio axinellae TaxID=989403 RepID=A0A165TW98_9HYPH|nr:hypothetical protein PsAD2_04224 [Pseudovibrio axinellae]SER61450.1 Uncharacterized conserved protein, DUF983 family [Pseudovibrio axinellae]